MRTRGVSKRDIWPSLKLASKLGWCVTDWRRLNTSSTSPKIVMPLGSEECIKRPRLRSTLQGHATSLLVSQNLESESSHLEGYLGTYRAHWNLALALAWKES